MSRTIRRALLAAALVSTTLGFVAHAQWWNKEQQRMQRLLPKSAQAPTEVVYSFKTYYQARNAVTASVVNEEFDTPDRMHDEFLQSGQRSTHGLFMVEAIQSGWDDRFDTPDPKDIMRSVDRWTKAKPDSRLRKLVEAIRWQRQAWVARGGAYASSVPGEGVTLFRERLALATKALAAAEPSGKESPLWYWVALIVAGSSGQPAAQFDGLFEEAVGRFPHYHTLYYTRMNYLLPQWGGNFEAVDEFIAKSVERTRPVDGEAFYAWLYVDVARKFDGDIFNGTLAMWPRMKKGFEDMVARYPDNWNKSLFATFACRARDRETTARLLTELGAQAQLGQASPGYTTDSCRRFAFMPA
jgi:hypothetical protein